MYVLGISCYYHDASATLINDRSVVATCAEERFTRKKHDNSFPINAIKYCLDSQDITIDDISHIGFYEKPLVKFERVLYQHLEMFPRSFKTFLSSMPFWLTNRLRIVKMIKKKLKYNSDMVITMMGVNDNLLYLRYDQTLGLEGRPFYENLRVYKLGKLLREAWGNKIKNVNSFKDTENYQMPSELGEIFRSNEQLDEAEVVFGKAIELDPDSKGAYSGLGATYRHQNVYDSEIESILKKKGFKIEVSLDNSSRETTKYHY